MPDDVGMGEPRAISNHAHEALCLATTLHASLVIWRFATGRKELIDRWHDACEVVVADLMGASYSYHNPLDRRTPDATV
jgi:hypothetical protein